MDAVEHRAAVELGPDEVDDRSVLELARQARSAVVVVLQAAAPQPPPRVRAGIRQLRAVADVQEHRCAADPANLADERAQVADVARERGARRRLPPALTRLVPPGPQQARGRAPACQGRELVEARRGSAVHQGVVQAEGADDDAWMPARAELARGHQALVGPVAGDAAVDDPATRRTAGPEPRLELGG